MVDAPTSKLTELDEDGEPRRDTAAAQTREAKLLYQTLENWQNSAAQLHERVRAGNYVYQHAAQVCRASRRGEGRQRAWFCQSGTDIEW